MVANKYDTSTEPLGSTAAKVLFNNAGNADIAMNALVPSWQDRPPFNRNRLTWYGIEQQWANFLISSGYEFIGDYDAPGELTFTKPNQVMSKSGEYWRPAPTLVLPYTTVNNWVIDQPKFVSTGDASLRQALANTADMTLGANLVGRAAYTFNSVAQMITKTGRYDGDVCILLGFRTGQEGWGGGLLRWNANSVSTVGLNGQRFKVTGVPTGCWERFTNGAVNISDWGAYNDNTPANVAINNAAFAAARDYVAATLATLQFTPGIYCYTLSPNWAIQNATIEALGEVRMRYSGTGDAMIIDGTGQPNAGCYNNRVYGFEIDAPTTAQNGVLVAVTHHGTYKFKVRGAGANYAGIKVVGCVCNRLEDPEVSPNADGGWYLNAMPQTGLWMTGGVGTQSSYCTVTNPIMEGLAKVGSGCGILLEGSFGNMFISGTSEGCVTGIALGTVAQGCRDNKFFGIDLEANTGVDVYDQAAGSEYHSVNSTLKVTVVSSARRPQFFGGRYLNIEIASGALGCGFFGVIYNRDDIVPAGTLTSGEPTVATQNCTDEKANARGPFSQQTVTVLTGTFTYTNNTGNAQQAILGGGTVTAVSIRRGGVNNGVTNVAGEYTLAPGDGIVIASSSAPNLRILTL